jgi:dihydroorotate dehydrogenase
VGVNIGKSKITPVEDAVEDYASSARVLGDVSDYLVINVSSPNTPGLRGLQDADTLRAIIQAVQSAAVDVPLMIKLSPDLDDDGLDAAVETAVACGCTGIIATNTTLQRPADTGRLGEAGGLSGAPIWPLAKSRIERVLATANGRVPVVGSGGIHSAAQVQQLLDAGCVAVQLYSGLIFDGPGLVHSINDALEPR